MQVNLDLDQSIRQQLAQMLGLILADMYVLYTKTQNFHWNVVDSRFYSLHLFFEKQYEALAEAVDEVAERIRMLGQKTPATLKQFLEMSSLKESKEDFSGDEMIADLLNDHEALARLLRDRIQYATKLGDEGTADLLIQQLRFHEKTAWMLRSHLMSEY